jgi:uncharacterized protein (DUF697 family)
MNRSLFLHVVERLEGLVNRLPATIQKPIINELTPLKELFLQQRPPRFVFSGSPNTPLSELMAALFPEFSPVESGLAANRKDHWRDYSLRDRGTISILDARTRGAGDAVGRELETAPPDIIFFVDDEERKKPRKEPLENFSDLVERSRRRGLYPAVVGVIYDPGSPDLNGERPPASASSERASRLSHALESKLSQETALRILAVRGSGQSRGANDVISVIGRHVPNEARIETARVFGDKQAQTEIGQLLVKSTSAICTAIGAQPIPLADLPILTTLQLVMVSGIMYVSGRERSLRAATEFVAALGANVGVGMLLREGARAILKFIPGWGNVVCGMVAGAGTYAIGRAAIAYFLEGLSLREARRTYFTTRRRSGRQVRLSRVEPDKQPAIEAPKRVRRPRLRH